jgi:uncharacterized protein YndB with AHSA1/START domain
MNPQTQSVVVEYDLPHPPKKVWRALTEPQLIARWLMENDFRPEVGHRFTFKAPPQPQWDGTVQCEVLEVVPHERLRYSWVGGAGEFRLDTTVTWTLTARPSGGTLLKLEHSGFLPTQAFALEGLSKGWRGRVGDRLKEIIASLD